MALEEVQKAIDQFSEIDGKYALSVMCLFEMLTKGGFYGTRAFESKQGYYDFDFQVACLRFARVVCDEEFDVWLQLRCLRCGASVILRVGRGMSLDNIGPAFSMALTLDKLLIGYRDRGQKEQDGRFKVYQTSKNVPLQSWKALLKRWDERQLVLSENAEKLAKEARESVEAITPPSASTA